MAKNNLMFRDEISKGNVVVTTDNYVAWVESEYNWSTASDDVEVRIASSTGDTIVRYANLSDLTELVDLLTKVVATSQKMLK